jgi:hypothetical protein
VRKITPLMHPGHSFSRLCLLSCRFVKQGALMYTLSNIDFSEPLGFVVSELTPDETDRQDQTLDARQRDALATGLELAVFGAA